MSLENLVGSLSGYYKTAYLAAKMQVDQEAAEAMQENMANLDARGMGASGGLVRGNAAAIQKQKNANLAGIAGGISQQAAQNVFSKEMYERQVEEQKRQEGLQMLTNVISGGVQAVAAPHLAAYGYNTMGANLNSSGEKYLNMFAKKD